MAERGSNGKYLPGVSGNPGQRFTGGPNGTAASYARRPRVTKRLLKQCIRERSLMEIPEAVRKKLRLKTPEDITFAEALAARIWIEALTGAFDRSVVRTTQVIGAEPRELDISADVEVAGVASLEDRLDRLFAARREANGTGRARRRRTNGAAAGSG